MPSNTRVPQPTVSVVIVAYGAEPWLEDVVTGVLASRAVDIDVVLVDNGCTDGGVDRLEDKPGVTVIRPGANTGFAGGCNLGATRAKGEYLAFLNPDARAEPDALAELVKACSMDDVAIATASVRLADRPHLLNSAGNEIHATGVSWSGHFEEPAADYSEQRDVIAASGAAMLMPRRWWDLLGGFEERFFAYYEDADLSLRVWQRGGRVVYVPTAVVHHRYEFSRRPEKYFLLERNRDLMVLTCFEGGTLLRLAPVLVVLEIGFLGLAIAQGWGRAKLRSWAWLIRNRRYVRRRRAAVQGARKRSDRQLSGLLAADLLPANITTPGWWPLVNRCLRWYCELVLPGGGDRGGAT